AGVDAVDARPRFPTVGGAVEAAVLVAVGSLRLLNVFALAAVNEAVGTAWIEAGHGDAAAAAAELRSGPAAEGDDQVVPLAIASYFQSDLVARPLPAELVGEIAVGQHDLVVDADDDVADLQACLGGRPVRHDFGEASPSVGVVSCNAEVAAGLLLLR